MKITIQSLHFNSKDELNDFVMEKVSKLSHLYERIESANVSLKLDKSGDNDNKVCEIRLAIPGNDLFAKRQSKSFEEATAETVAALEHQLKKMKAKLENHLMDQKGNLFED